MKAARSTILTKSLAIMLVGVMIGGQSAPDGWTYESATRGESQHLHRKRALPMSDE